VNVRRIVGLTGVTLFLSATAASAQGTIAPVPTE
jgi:hypothetical protein